jgi:hypothetical protein
MYNSGVEFAKRAFSALAENDEVLTGVMMLV